MVSYVSLRKTGAGWEFESEAALEDFVWANLERLFRLTPLKRQHSVNGKVCNILALGENKQLVVLELKNAEDRYIVQQLTRYYDALLESKPFTEQLNYGQPVRLVAIAPSFHRDNFTDRKYHPLSFHFLQFSVIQDCEKFYLQLKDIENGMILHLEIPYKQEDSPENITAPPRVLLNILNNSHEDEREKILLIRRKILSFDPRMQETNDSKRVTYQKGKSIRCAEFKLQKKHGIIRLFLWLPIPNYDGKKMISKMMCWTSDWESVSALFYYPKGKAKASKAWVIGDLMKFVGKGETSNSLDALISVALETWLARL